MEPSPPPILFISLSDLLECESFPRNPDQRHITVPLSDIDTTRSFMVFISHCWMRGWPGAEGYDGRPHPDNVHHDKLALCQKGIKKLADELAPECENCYVWLDFGCINQNKDPCGELKQLDKIIEVCDCMFTPIVEDREEQDKAEKSDEDDERIGDEFAKNYRSKKWDGDDHAYLSRGWTRVEMFYASAIPLSRLADADAALARKRGAFRAGLQFAASQGRRPQFVYGSYQMRLRLPVRVLPPLLHSYFHQYNPINGTLSVSSDRVKIIELVEELKPFLQFAEEGYVGEFNAKGEKDGFGKCTYRNGDCYEGQFVSGLKHGMGTYLYSDGCSYKGSWALDKENGFGVFTYACGDVYEGEMKDGRFHGSGQIVSVKGRLLRGEFIDDKYVGETVQQTPREGVERGGLLQPLQFKRALSTSDFVGDSSPKFDEAYSCSEFDDRYSVCSDD